MVPIPEIRWSPFSPSFWRKKKEKKKKKQHFTKDIVDFADEKIISFSELSDEERVVCRFLGDLLCAALFLIPAGIALVL